MGDDPAKQAAEQTAVVGLVAMDGLEAAAVNQVGEGSGEEVVAGCVAGDGVHFGVEHLLFERERTAITPAGDGHLPDDGPFGVVARPEATGIDAEGVAKGVLVFVGQADDLGTESVAEGVAAGACLAFRSLGAARARTIGAGSGAAFC
jgi:hypothetical protein